MVATRVALFTSFGLAAAGSWMSLPGSLFTGSGWGSCTDASWPLTNVGQPIVPQQPDELLKQIVAEVDTDRVKQIITTLANFGTRHTLSSQTDPKRGIGAARDWVYDQMQGFANESNGNLQVYLNSYIQPVADRILFPVNISNIVAEVKGSVDPNRAYVVTGHYDSRRIDINDYTGDAPGADDDASGVAVVMEMARICACLRPKATMIFAVVAAEEQGLYGSNHLAQTLKNASVNVEGNWNNDIVGTGSSKPFNPINDYTIRLFGASAYYPNPNITLSSITTVAGENDSPARNLGRFIAEVAAGASKWLDMQVALIYRPDRYLRGGDHESFLQAGFPGVRFTEAVEDFAHQHQDVRLDNATGTQYGDLLEFVDFNYTARVAKVNLATMWSAANAPGTPRSAVISEVIGFPAITESTPLEAISNDSQFAWAATNDTLVDSYEVVWRSTGNLQWTNYINVGKVYNVTLNLPKDDYQFGIRAVGRDGKKSPAIYPLPVNL
ncbi:peptidase M28 [Myriangium duriaei CBS 260.36]|uniref:Peptide hydrolase n=1 Tax=Myriangium duriaei CBS 260.36 TaxID=1168546 RepID=A0A9P4J1Y5_9PEZI|nr:peptidase M28 [Myriangium duriaei CBS 260.36]